MSEIQYIRQALVLRKQVSDLKVKRHYVEQQKNSIEDELGTIKPEHTISEIIEKNKGKRIFSDIIQINIDSLGSKTLRQGILYLLEKEGIEQQSIKNKTVDEILSACPKARTVLSKLGVAYNDTRVLQNKIYFDDAESKDLVRSIIRNINNYLVCKTDEERIKYQMIEPIEENMLILDAGISELESQISELDDMIKQKADSKKIDDSITKIKEKIRLSSTLAGLNSR